MFRKSVAFALGLITLVCTVPPIDAQTQAPTQPAQAQQGVCANPAAAGPTVGGTWEKRTPSTLFRSETAAAVLGDQIYVAGGLAGTTRLYKQITNSFVAYNATTDTWKDLAPLPEKLHHISLASAAGAIYMTGGYTALDFIADRKSTWRYDPAADKWSAVADMPAARAAATMSTLNDVIYLVGGVTAASAQLWTYDPAADKWNTSHTPMPTAREHLTSAFVDGKLYVIGGETPNSDGTGNETYVKLATTEVYDPATDHWTTVTSMPTARSSITSGVIDGKIHLVSGENVADNCVFPEHDVYDPKTDKWSAMADLATPRHGAVSGVVNGRWYVIDGATIPGLLTITALTNTVEVFIPAASS